ncbi:MAG: GSCFA domain-containing protein [Rhodobacteraceae bacterium]|nr:GSCFA domain-containing protein [Paracoccaceae bacterium]
MAKKTTATSAIRISAEDTGKGKHGTWFRGEHTHFNPDCADMIGPDAVPEQVLAGWLPPEPFIKPETRITAFGSCFASNISDWLSKRNFRVLNKADDATRAYVVTMGEGMVNSFVIRQQFEWAWEGRVFDQPLWHGYKAEAFGYDAQVQAETRRIFDDTEVFILTFGLSEVWYDEPTGNVFWRTIPKDAYDPERHKFRVSTVEENRDNIGAIYRLIRKHRPDAKVIFTLSPIPLIATFRDNSCLTSNSVSKSVLRVAIDEVVRANAHEGHLFYWPSYEIVTDVFKLPYKPDRRHVETRVLRYIMALFEHSWCDSPADNPPPPLAPSWARACAVSGLLPHRIEDIVAKRRKYRLRQMLSRGDELDPDPGLDKAKRGFLRGILRSWDAEDEAYSTAAE